MQTNRGDGEILRITLIAMSVLFIAAILIFTASFVAGIVFNRHAAGEVEELFGQLKSGGETVEDSDLADLPPCVQKWMEYSGVVGQPEIQTVRMKKNGLLRTKPGQSWMKFSDEQYFRLDEPGFIWKARIKAAPLIFLMGRDKYYEGHGNMLIKFLGLAKVADASGPETDQGTLLRYLAESVWFPSAALSSYVIWEEIDVNSAWATMNYRGISASGVFEFNQKGEPVSFVAQRYMAANGQFSLETWSTHMKDYEAFNEIKIPAQADIVWKLKSGDFHWYHVQVNEAEYNKPSVY
ncbi:DUF6544 family protein [Syntrophomonas curvata]